MAAFVAGWGGNSGSKSPITPTEIRDSISGS